MRGKYFGQIVLYFLFFLVKEVKLFEEEILNRYGKIKTKYSSMIVNSSEFNINDDIFLTLDSYSMCDDYLRYQFYDEINDIYKQKTDLKYNIKPVSKILSNIIGRKTSIKLYYTINKNRGIIGNLKGNILYIEFRCEGEVLIKNTINDDSSIFVYFGVFIIIIFIIIFCFLFAKGCLFGFFCLSYIFKKKSINNINNAPNPVRFSTNQNFMHNPNRVIYVSQDQIFFNNRNIYQNNQNLNRNNLGNNIPNSPINKQNSERSSYKEIMNTTDRNLIFQGS